jgi:polyisoprenoid-binding protein YceI
MTAKVLLLALLASTAANAEKAWIFEPGQTLVSIEMGPARARILATSLNLTGKMLEQDDGAMQAEVHIAVASFATGKPARDAQLRQASDAAQFPEIVFIGATSKSPRDGVAQLDGTLTLHGVTRRLVVPVSIVRARGMTYGHATLVLHLADFGLAAPKCATDEVRVDVDAGLRPEGALASRG